MAFRKPYNPTYKPGQTEPFSISRSKIELFMQCPRCFYLDRRLDIKRPSTPPFTLNSTVDELLKKEFDFYRAKEEQHPIQIKYKTDLKPANHQHIDLWRDPFKGVRAMHKPTNLEIFGGIDDLWINSQSKYVVVDYKATARTQPVTSLGNAFYHDAYRRQLEVYQWLLAQNGLVVSGTGYWLYATARKGEPAFDSKLVFDQRLIEYQGKTDWIEPTLVKIKQTIESDTVPNYGQVCDYCPYSRTRTQLTLDYLKNR